MWTCPTGRLGCGVFVLAANRSSPTKKTRSNGPWAQQQHRLNGGAPVFWAVTLLQRGARPCQGRVNQFGEKPIAVRFGEEAGRERRGGKEFCLGGEVWQAHRGPMTEHLTLI